MANSIATIQFSEDMPLGAFVSLKWIINPSITPGAYVYSVDFVNVRSAYGEVSVGVPTANPGERSAINFAQSLNLDISVFTVTRNVNIVTIEANLSFGYSLTFLEPYPSHESVFINYVNYTTDVFTIDLIEFSPAVITCTHVKMTVETNNLATKILSPVIVNPNTNNPFEFEVLRGSTFSLQLENNNGTQISQTIIAPDLLNEANFVLNINNSQNGATAIVTSINILGLDLEYSLDNSIWQISNVFSGLLADDYTLYVRDQFGCSFYKTFNVDEFGIYVPNFYISKSNSFRFANRITFGDIENYKNDENTLSCEVDVVKPCKEIQRFQSADVITTQFRSNYATNTAKIIKQDLTEVSVPIIKMTNNIGLKDKRDARQYDLGNGKTGVYFLSGNIYDYVSNIITGPYSLNGLLPEWAQIGNYISIVGAWYLIEDIVFDESKNADVIVFTNTYLGAEINIIASTVFNRENYEVYQFTIDMVDYIDQYFRIKLENIDPHFTTITHLSELIWCKVKHDEVLEIKYKNTTNTDVMYSTGIEHLIRIPYLKFGGKPDENSEIHKTDTNAILLNADLYECDEILFKPVTKEIWRKIMIALSHENVTINGVGYVKNGNFNTDGPLDSTNLYVLTAIMIKTGSVYNSQTSGASGFDGSQVAVPGLISTETGFVSY